MNREQSAAPGAPLGAIQFVKLVAAIIAGLPAQASQTILAPSVSTSVTRAVAAMPLDA